MHTQLCFKLLVSNEVFIMLSKVDGNDGFKNYALIKPHIFNICNYWFEERMMKVLHTFFFSKIMLKSLMITEFDSNVSQSH